MNYFTIDHIIVYASLFITLLVGLRAGRNIKTIQEYAVGNRMFGTTALVFTYLATNLAGSDVLNNAGMVFSEGIIVIFSFFGFFIAENMMALFVTHKIVMFRDCFTIGDLMRNFYGYYGGVITGILALLQAGILAAMELVALGIICESLLGIKPGFGLIVGGLILAAYSAHGGIKAVVTTDVLQFITLIIGIPLLAYIAVHKAGGMQLLFTQVPSTKLTILHHERFYYYFVCFLSWGIFPSGLIDPAIFQRMLMAKNARQLRHQFFITSISNPFFQVIIMLIGLAGWTLYPQIEANEIVPHIIRELLPQGIKGLTIAGLFSLTMSTVDSYLHIAGLTLVHDVVQPICKKYNIHIRQEHRWAQVSTLLLGFLAIRIALITNNMFELFLDSLACTGPILMFPLLSSIMGLKPEKKAFYIAMFVTVAAWLSCNVFLPEDYNYLATLISIVVNGLTFFSSHFWINNGFKTVKQPRSRYLNEYEHNSSFLQNFLPKNLYAYIQQQLQLQDSSYILAGMFCLLNVIIPHFLWDNMIKLHTKFLLVIYSLGSILSLILMLQDKFSRSFQEKYLPYLFYLALLYCLPFSSTLMFIISHGDSCWLTNIFLCLILLMVLVDWGMILLLSLLGLGFSLLFYPYFGCVKWEWHVTSMYLVIYQLLLAIFIGIFFSYKKKKQLAQITHKQDQLYLSHNLHKADHLYMLQAQAIQKRNLDIQKEPLSIARKALISLAERNPTEADLAQKGIDQLDAFVNYYKASFYQTMDALRLNVATISLERLLIKINANVNNANWTKRISLQLLTQQEYITCDVEKIVPLLADSLKTLLWESPAESCINLTIRDTELCYHLQAITHTDYMRKLPALAFLITQEMSPLVIASSYTGTTLPRSLEVPKTAADLVQRNQVQIIEAHYGHQEGQSSLYKLYVFPVAVDHIRSAIVDQELLPKDVPFDTPASLQLEQTFLDQLSKPPCALDVAIVKDAIEMIKHAHQGQIRKSGEPFYMHPLTVASIVLTMTHDLDAILAALLHDVVEDTPIYLEQIAYQYGQKVAYLVQTLTHLDSTGKKTKLTEAENHEQLASASNEYVIMIKLADRLHNVRTIGFHKPAKKIRIAQETLEFYVPLGSNLEGIGIKKVIEELKNICENLVKNR